MDLSWMLPHRPALLRHIGSIVGPDDAEDVLHDALVEIACMMDLSHVRDRRAWLFRVCGNVAKDHLRDARRGPQRMHFPQAASLAEDLDAEDPQASPEDRLVFQAVLDDARRALATTDARQARVFEALVVHGTDWDAVAEALKVKPKTAKAWAKQMRLTLREAGVFTR